MGRQEMGNREMNKHEMGGIKKIIANQLQAQASDSHPDPELLTALAENGLAPAHRDRLLSHVSACNDCREILYLAMPEAAEVQPAFTVSRKRPRLAIRWATLAASVLIIGSVFIGNRGLFSRHSGENKISTFNSPAPARQSPQQAEVSAPPENPTVAAAQPVTRFRAPLKHMTAKPQAAMKFDQSGEVHFTGSTSLALDSESGANSKIAAPPTPTWRLSPQGAVMRSLDGGKNWHTMSVTRDGPFHVVNSVGFVVWAGGSAGVLYRSDDEGEHWTKIEPAIGTYKLTSDITQINFPDPANGVISTANGEVWVTSDGGKNWQLK